MTDLFCGAGGSSTGAVSVPGVTVKMAANHWQLAIDTHNTNHPLTDHSCADVSQVRPQLFPRTDILWASPECTNHSVARGVSRKSQAPDLFGDALPDEAAERSRATMWDVPRFAEFHRYRAIIVENVVDAAKWILWEPWVQAMRALGYRMRIVYLNSMHAQAGGLPAPQSRDRMYVVCWREGERAPDLDRWVRPWAACPTCGPVQCVQSWKSGREWGRYRAQYVWRCPNALCRNGVVEPGWLPAAAAIDWSIPGQRIGDRDKPLAVKTMARIRAGLERYASDPFLTVHRGDRGGNDLRTSPIGAPTPALTASGNHFGLVAPMLVPAGGSWNESASSVTEVMRARTTRESEGLLVPVEGREGKTAQHVSEPMRTMTTRNETGIVITLRGQNAPKSTADPLDTFAANGFHHALLMRNNEGGAEMSTPVHEVMRTLTTKGHQSLLQWGDLVHDYNGPARLVDDVLPTQTTVEGDAVYSAAVDPMDCLFRMLEPAEIARGMAFPADYRILGNRREQVKQAGNAVTPPAARDLISAVAEALAGAA